MKNRYKKILVITIVVLIILFFTNPGGNQFRSYLREKHIDDVGLYAVHNYYFFSVFVDIDDRTTPQTDHYYFGILLQVFHYTDKTE